MQNSVQERLKFLISSLNLTIRELSKKTGIPYRTLQDYLLGKRMPGGENLQRICTHLSVNLNWLLTGEGEPFIKKLSEKQYLIEEAKQENLIKIRLKFLIDTLKISISKFAEMCDVPYMTISNYLSGRRKPTSDVLEKIAKAHNVNLNWLLTGQGSMFNIKDAIEAKIIPVYAKIPAGYPVMVAEEAIEYISVPHAPINAFAIIAKGESMSPTIKDGEYLICVPMPTDIQSGDIVIALNEWNETMIKRYRVKDGEVYLTSDNPEYPTFRSNEHYKIVAKVIEKITRTKL